MSVISGEDYKCIQGHEQEVLVDRRELRPNHKDPRAERRNIARWKATSCCLNATFVWERKERSHLRGCSAPVLGKNPKSQAAPVGASRSHLKTPGHTIA